MQRGPLWWSTCGLAAVVSLVPAAPATAQDVAEIRRALADQKVLLDTVWVLLAALLVFGMQAGFAYVESGLTRAKNTASIMMKNLVGFALGTLAFWAVGFALMFGDGNGVVGRTGWLLQGADNSPATGAAYRGVYGALSGAGVPLSAKFLFQLALAATAAAIVSGAMAERTRFPAHLIASAATGLVVYPVVGHWIWGGGWLQRRGLWDGAGATVVHSTGGWMALVGAVLVGPRIGKFTKSGRVMAIPGHSLPMAALGVFLLWLGWFGFNAGSTMAADLGIARIALTTNLAAATGTLGAMAVSWLVIGKPDASMTLNGVLAGLVVISAPCAVVSPVSAAIIGLLGGAGAVLAVLALDRMRIDDPVGAISVHGLSGALGTACVGLFAERRYAPAHTLGDGLFFGGGAGLLVNQVLGVAAVFGWCLACGLLVFGTLKRTIGLRVSAEEEVAGLDLGAHGSQAYPDFQPTVRAPVPVGHYPDAAIRATPELRRPPGREPVPMP